MLCGRAAGSQVVLVKREELRGPDVVGTFARPDDDLAFPGVLALGGSDGGIPRSFIEALVPQGFAVLALAYHRGFMGAELGDLVPTDIYELPLERIQRGLRWLIEQPQVSADEGRVGVVGASLGGELALLIASVFPDLVGPVVGYTPSNAVWQGWAWSSPDQRNTSRWSHRGQPLPFAPYLADVSPAVSESGVSLLPMYECALDQHEAVARAEIPIERATGPILLISGGDDACWPAERMCRAVVKRMVDHGRASDVRHLNYPEAGHMVGPWEGPYNPDDSPFLMDMGGTLEADAAAVADAFPIVIAHLRSAR